jgi:hypothetical protein
MGLFQCAGIDGGNAQHRTAQAQGTGRGISAHHECVPSFVKADKTTKSHACLARREIKDHIPFEERSRIMQNIRSIFLMLAGVTVFVALALFTFSVTLAVGGILTVLMVGRAMSLKMKPAPVRAKAQTQQREMRIWNDGRGTIIDL